MTSTDIAMLICGIVLLVVALGLLIYCVMNSKPYKALLATLPIAIIMIGFSQLHSFTINASGVSVEVNDTTKNFAENPNDATYRTNYSKQLMEWEKDRNASPKQGLSPEARTNLEHAVTALKERKNLTPETRVDLSRSELLLDQTNAARLTLQSAIKADPALTHSLDANLKSILNVAKPATTKP